MSFTLGDALKARERERASKAGDLKKSAEAYAAVLKEQELQRKRNAHAQEQERLAEQNLEILRERERKRIEDERKTKRYFQVDKYGRKVPVEDAPVYFGDMIEKFDAWLPHGKGQFSLNETIIMKGDFNQGDFTGGEVKWSDGTYWEGKLVDHKMHGVGVITLADGVKKEAMMRANALVCYKEELHNGKQIEFEEQVFDVYPAYNRKPVATVICNIKDWVFLCKFQDEVWPQDRKIDLAVTSKFNLLRLRPIIYPLQGFGIPSDPERIYDYRYIPKVNRSLLRDSASNILHVQESTAAIFQQDPDDVSLLGAEEDDDFSQATGASKLKGRLSSITLTKSLKATSSAGSLTASANSTARGLMRSDSQSTLLSSVPLLSVENSKESRRLNGPGLKRLVPKFPTRSKLDRTDNFFESRAVGIGAAKEEDDRALQDELRKRQWAALIEERRAKQNADKQREIEEQQQNFLAQSLAEKKDNDASAKMEKLQFERDTQLAIENELRMLSR